MILTFDLVSDMHIDSYSSAPFKWKKNKNPESTILVDAGDDSNRPSRTFSHLKAAREVYDMVVVVDGNHHHYDSNAHVDEAMEEFRTFAKDNDIVYLDGTNEYYKDGVLFLGACGWYDWRIGLPNIAPAHAYFSWTHNMNDVYIKFNKRPDEYALEQYTNILKKLKEAQDRPEVEKIVIVTHTVPLKECLIWKPHDHRWNLLNGSYANSNMINIVDGLEFTNQKTKITTWAYGHSHFSNDFDKKGIRFLNNSRGYLNEKNWRGPLAVTP